MLSVTPHTGVWIETLTLCNVGKRNLVSRPTRACGLKHLVCRLTSHLSQVTPHTGVWIETDRSLQRSEYLGVTPHTGVWIETFDNSLVVNALPSRPTRACGLKLVLRNFTAMPALSRPTRACGLKLVLNNIFMTRKRVTPHTGVWIETTLFDVDKSSPCHAPHGRVD